jgi:hypothetical protein
MGEDSDEVGFGGKDSERAGFVGKDSGSSASGGVGSVVEPECGGLKCGAFLCAGPDPGGLELVGSPELLGGGLDGGGPAGGSLLRYWDGGGGKGGAEGFELPAPFLLLPSFSSSSSPLSSSFSSLALVLLEEDDEEAVPSLSSSLLSSFSSSSSSVAASPDLRVRPFRLRRPSNRAPGSSGSAVKASAYSREYFATENAPMTSPV